MLCLLTLVNLSQEFVPELSLISSTTEEFVRGGCSPLSTYLPTCFTNLLNSVALSA